MYCHLEGIYEPWSCYLGAEVVPLFLLQSQVSLSNFRVHYSAVEVFSGLEFGKWAFRWGVTTKHQMQLFTVILMEEQGRWMVFMAGWLLLASYWEVKWFPSSAIFLLLSPQHLHLLKARVQSGEGAQVQRLLQVLVVRQLWAKMLLAKIQMKTMKGAGLRKILQFLWIQPWSVLVGSLTLWMERKATYSL